MNDLIINVNWEYFLGIVGTLIALSYYANGRFTKLETSVEWLKQAIRDLTLTVNNLRDRKSSKRSNVSTGREPTAAKVR